MRRGPSRLVHIPEHLRRRVQFSLLYLALIIIFIALSMGLYKGGVHLVTLQAHRVTLSELPSALTLSMIRIILAYIMGLLFSLTAGLMAARYRWAEKIIIPCLDILQSVPVVGFFPAVISFFIALTNGHRIGVEFAAIFLIFTSQAWNIAFAVYESVKSAPQEQIDAVMSFGLKGSQRFWKFYLPLCTPRLVYNTILSWTNGWFFLVACEIIANGPVRYYLPGIGSFLARAAESDNTPYLVGGLVALTSTIILLDMFIWKPLTLWSFRFRNETVSDLHVPPQSLVYKFYSSLSRTLMPIRKVVISLFYPFVWFVRDIVSPLLWDLPTTIVKQVGNGVSRKIRTPFAKRQGLELEDYQFFRKSFWIKILNTLAWIAVAVGTFIASYTLARWLRPPWPDLVFKIPEALLFSTARLVTALVISALWVFPVVLLLWNRTRLRNLFSTLAQIGASLPAIALFPLFVLLIANKVGGGMELSSLLLLLTGMQWYLLFNCLAGAAAVPSDLVEVTQSYGLSTTDTWKKLVLPTIAPAAVTGTITAWGGGWNALVVSEYVTFKNEVLKVQGIGALLNESVYSLGDSRATMLVLTAMIAWIIVLNVILWQPLYRVVTQRYRMDLG